MISRSRCLYATIGTAAAVLILIGAQVSVSSTPALRPALTNIVDQTLLLSLQQQALFGPGLIESGPTPTPRVLVANKTADIRTFHVTVQNRGDCSITIARASTDSITVLPGESRGVVYKVGFDEAVSWTAQGGQDCSFVWVVR